MKELLIVFVLIPCISILVANMKASVIANIEQLHRQNVSESNQAEVELFRDRLQKLERQREGSSVVGF